MESGQIRAACAAIRQDGIGSTDITPLDRLQGIKPAIKADLAPAEGTGAVIQDSNSVAGFFGWIIHSMIMPEWNQWRAHSPAHRL